MIRLLRFLRPHLGRALLALALSFLAVAAQIGLLGTSAYLISRAALRPATILLLMVPIVGVQFFSMGRSSFRYLERLTSHDVTFRLLSDLRVWFYRQLDARQPADLGRVHSGEILSRAVHDIESLQEFYLRALAPPVVLLLTAVLVFFLLLPMAPSIAWTVSSLLLLGSLPAVLQLRLGQRAGGEMLRKRGALSIAVADGVRGVSELLAFGGADGYRAKLDAAQERLLAAQGRMRRQAGMSSALLGLLGNLATLAALVLAIPLVRAGRLPGWDLAVVAFVALASFEAAQPMSQSFQALGQCLAAGRRIFDIVDQPAACAPPTTALHPAGAGIVVRDLRVRYDPQATPAVRGIDFELPPGKHIAVVGASGAGKTTLISALTGFAPFIEGSVRLGGVPIEAIRREEIWEMSAVISRDTSLFNVSLKENLRLGRPEASDAEVAAAAAAASLQALVAVLPEGLDTPVGEQGTRLSGGERQRVAIARAILKDAPILLLDEPTEGLDAVTEEAVLRDILRFAAGRSLLMVTHRMVALDAMDEILVLSGGRVVERGRHEELLAARGVYEQLFRLQGDHLGDS